MFRLIRRVSRVEVSSRIGRGLAVGRDQQYIVKGDAVLDDLGFHREMMPAGAIGVNNGPSRPEVPGSMENVIRPPPTPAGKPRDLGLIEAHSKARMGSRSGTMMGSIEEVGPCCSRKAFAPLLRADAGSGSRMTAGRASSPEFEQSVKPDRIRNVVWKPDGIHVIMGDRWGRDRPIVQSFVVARIAQPRNQTNSLL